jgi:hypothetical protein
MNDFDQSESWPMGQLHPGRRLETSDRPRNWLGESRILLPATSDNIAAARTFFAEIPEADLEREGNKVWVDKGSGQRFRKAHGAPLASTTPKKVADVFTIIGNCLVFLIREGRDEGESVLLGTSHGGRKATGQDRNV